MPAVQIRAGVKSSNSNFARNLNTLTAGVADVLQVQFSLDARHNKKKTYVDDILAGTGTARKMCVYGCVWQINIGIGVETGFTFWRCNMFSNTDN